jgi:cytoskeletal protein CcmA (bactofilin family)
LPTRFASTARWSNGPLSSELVVGEAGVVTGEIEVARCLVGGQVRGKVRASEQVVLHATARVWAEIRTPALVMEPGAFLEGKVTMVASKQAAAGGAMPPGTATVPPSVPSLAAARSRERSP